MTCFTSTQDIHDDTIALIVARYRYHPDEHIIGILCDCDKPDVIAVSIGCIRKEYLHRFKGTKQ